EIKIVTRRAGLAQQKSSDFDAVTGHVGQNPAALALRLPEPRHVRAAVLLGGARQIGPAANRHRAPPDDVFAALHGAREYLIFQIAVQQRSIGREPQHLAGFNKRTPERLLASDAD